MAENKSPTRGIVLTALGALVSVVPPALAVMSYFPIWAARSGEAALSGFTLLLLLIAALPLSRLIKRMIKSPSVPFVWFILFLIFFALSHIANEMVVISLIGFISNLVGAILFRLAKRGVADGK